GGRRGGDGEGGAGVRRVPHHAHPQVVAPGAQPLDAEGAVGAGDGPGDDRRVRAAADGDGGGADGGVPLRVHHGAADLSGAGGGGLRRGPGGASVLRGKRPGASEQRKGERSGGDELHVDNTGRGERG